MGGYIERWNLHHRLQHGCLALSMMGLLATGLTIKYSYTGWAPAVHQFLGGFQRTLQIHKASAILLCLVAVWHLIYLAYGYRKYGLSLAMVPTSVDTQASVDHALFLLGLRNELPKADRYNYLEKFEYLAIFWGMIVMGLSGLIIWFPVTFGAWMPRWMLDATRIIHSNEAFVALLSLAFGHFFFAHFNPNVFPSSPVWFSGKISLHQLHEEHPLEFDRMVAEGRIDAATADKIRQHAPNIRLSGWRRAVGVVELVIYSAVFYWLLITFIPMLLA